MPGQGADRGGSTTVEKKVVLKGVPVKIRDTIKEEADPKPIFREKRQKMGRETSIWKKKKALLGNVHFEATRRPRVRNGRGTC